MTQSHSSLGQIHITITDTYVGTSSKHINAAQTSSNHRQCALKTALRNPLAI